MPLLRVLSHWNPNAVVVASLLFVGVAAPAEADVIYRYTGNPYTNVDGSDYTTSDFISIELHLSGALPADSIEAIDLVPLLLSWTFDDGAQTRSSTAGDDALQFTAYGTDGNTMPKNWYLVAQDDNGASFSRTAYGGGTEFDEAHSPNPGYGFNTLSRGVWTFVPEPTTISLCGLGLLGIGSMRRGRRAAV